jgi:hypothetical protein
MASGHAYPPVGGVSFAVSCDVMADVARQSMQTGQPPPPGTNPYLMAAMARGIDAATWMRAQLVWGCRTMLDPEIGLEQGREISRAVMPNMPDYSGMMPQVQVPRPEPVDPNDPRLSPVDGVSIDTYVQMVAVQMTSPTFAPEEFADVARQLGFPPDRWMAVMEQWGNRVMAGPPASTRYAELVCQLITE